MFNQEITVFRNIVPKIVEQDVYRFLGFKQESTVLSSRQRLEIQHLVDYTTGFLEMSAVGCIKPVLENTGTMVVLGDYEFESCYMCKWLRNCSHVVIMGATTGREVVFEIDRLQQNKLSEAVIVNAIASSAVDEALEYVQQFYRKLAVSNRMLLTNMRWSAGYADLDLEYQHSFYEILKLNTLGVDITEGGMLVPEKSVTAFCGIKRG